MLHGLVKYLENVDERFKGIKYADIFRGVGTESLRVVNPLILESGGTLAFHLDT